LRLVQDEKRKGMRSKRISIKWGSLNEQIERKDLFMNERIVGDWLIMNI